MEHTTSKPIVRAFQPSHGSVASLTVGFISSLILTFAAFFAVQNHWFSNKDTLINFLILTALTQFVVQVMCFLHLGKESGSKWNLNAFLFMVVVVVIIVFGSIWIMRNLDYNMMMTPMETEKTIFEDEAIQPQEHQHHH